MRVFQENINQERTFTREANGDELMQEILSSNPGDGNRVNIVFSRTWEDNTRAAREARRWRHT